MAVALLDVNVLITLGWEDHVHHNAAHHWFAKQQPQGWATCPFTQCGFVRISANPRISPIATNPTGALKLLGQILRHPGHIFWPDDLQLDQALSVGRTSLIGHLQVTDAYLVGLANFHGGRLATFDKRVQSISQEKAVDIVPTA